MDGLALVILLQYQHARPLVVGRVLFHYGALSGTFKNIPYKNTIGRKFIIPVIRDEHLLARYQVKNAVKEITHQ